MLAIICVIYYSIFIGDSWMKWDMYDAIFPSFVTISEALKHWELPLWEPFQNRGVPIGNLMGIPVWFPITLLLGLLGYTQELMQVVYMIIVVMAGIFMYLALGNYVNNRWLCAIGGVAYATNGQFISNAQHITFIIAAALLPLIHYAVRRWINEQKIHWLILIGVSLGLLILNNYPPFVVITAIVIIIELLVFWREIKKGSKDGSIIKTISISMLMVILVAVLVGFVSVYTNLKVVTEITREGVPWEVATSSSLNIWNWLGAISPILVQASDSLNVGLDLSMSNTYIALPLLALVLIRKPKSKLDFTLILLSVVGFLLSMGQNAFLYRFIYEYIPGMDTFKFPSGFRYIYFYYITLLGIYNFNCILQEDKYKNKLNKLFLSIFLLYTATLIITLFILLFTTTFDRILFEKIIDELFYSTLLVGGIAFLLSYTSNKKHYVLAFSFLIITFSTLGVWRNDTYTIGVSERPESYGTEIEKIYGSTKGNMIANKYEEGKPLTFPETVFYQQFQTGGYVGSFELKTFNNALQADLLPHQGDPAVWVITEDTAFIENDILITKGVSRDSIGDFISYEPNKISGNLEVTQPSYLVLEQTFFPGWIVEVNNKKGELIQTDSGVIAVKINSGQSAFKFEFKPIGTIVSAYISFSVWLLLILYLVYLQVSVTRSNRP